MIDRTEGWAVRRHLSRVYLSVPMKIGRCRMKWHAEARVCSFDGYLQVPGRDRLLVVAAFHVHVDQLIYKCHQAAR